MQLPAIPQDEAHRLEVLRGLCVLDTPAEERFDRITRVAQRLFDVPIALVSLVDAGRQWFKSHQGLDATETPRDVSFCGHAILTHSTFVIGDATKDPRFADNPLVTGAPHVRFYAGQPLKAADGSRIGTLCIIDHKPREFTAEARALLADLGAWVERELNEQTLAQAVASADAHKRELQGVLDTVVDGIIVISARGQIQNSNPAAQTLFGYAPEEILGQNVKMLMPQPYAREHDGYLYNYLSTGNKKIIGIGREVTGKRKDGSTFPMELAVSEMEINGQRMFTGIVRDITERKLAEIEILSRENRIRALFDTIVDGIVVINSRGRIHSMNPAAQTLFGYEPDEMLGQNVKMLMPEPYAREHDGYLYNYLSTGNKKVIGKGREVTGRRKDGSTFPMELAVGEMEVNGQRMFTGIVRDITERKAIERLKTEFISTVSHELRTPLTSIMGSLDLIAQGVVGDVAPQVATMIEIAHKNSARLVRLINDILDIDKIESGSMRIDLRKHDLKSLIATAIEANRDFARQFGVSLVLEHEPPDAFVEVDSDRMLQVITNLLSNAAKFSPPSADVTVSVGRTDGWVRIAVADRGPGISPEFEAKIFQKFSQADSSDTRQKGGSGLGLNITKALVERMGGRIGFTSRSGSGATFFVELPESTSLSRVDAPDGAGPSTDAARVLICEDDRDVAKLLQMMLRDAGYPADVAYDADHARRLLKEGTYAALTVDIALPGESGIDFIRALRADRTFDQLPIVVVSANAEHGRRMVSGALRIVDWLDKPIDQERLLAAMHQALPQALARPRILHVEDDLDTIKVIRTLLRRDYEMHSVSTLAAAREVLRQQRFDLIVLDMQLPDGCGSELLPAIQALTAPPPVVIFSASEQQQEMSGIIAAALVKSRTSNDQLAQTLSRLLLRS